MAEKLEKIWYNRSGMTQVLRPLSWLFCSLVFLRRIFYRLHLLSSARLAVPVVVVGNLTVGGTGKTPLVAAIVNMLAKAGYRPGIISRGYGGKARHWPQQVRADSDPVMVGDEPVLLARRTGRPMAVGPDRVRAGRELLEYTDCDILVCDDGLQHYALQRDLEIVVIDGIRRFGNGYCLPAGPLREPVSRLQRADFLVTNGTAMNNEYAMQYQGSKLVNLLDPARQCELSALKSSENIHAVAGVGNPQRFFDTLTNAGLEITEHAFSDHHAYVSADLDFSENAIIVMTEKDAVKCQRFATQDTWYLPIEAILKDEFELQLLNRIESRYGQKST